MREVKVWTDGACRRLAGNGNMYQLGAGIVAECENHHQEWSVPLGTGTSQQAELLAIFEAFDLMTDRKSLHIILTTDSRYCQGVLTQQWTATANLPIIRACLLLMAEFGKVTILWVKGHAKDPMNCRADHLAGIACGRLKS
jgi:ribonuclease HI